MDAPPEESPGNVKVTREDWLSAARDVLVRAGVGEVKVLTLGQRLGVSRSSFYWYFDNRQELLEALLEDWEARNTRTLVAQCTRPTETISEAVCNFFLCFLDPGLFDQRLDFAVREWARRDAAVRARIDAADAERLAAVAGMFAAHGYGAEGADIRARILYFMQLGYHALDVREAMEVRMSRIEGYLEGFTGVAADAAAVEAFKARVRQVCQ